MGEKKPGDLSFTKAQITWKGPATSASRKPKPEQRLHPALKYHHTKTKDFRSQRTGCKPLQVSSLGFLFRHMTTSGNSIPTLENGKPFPSLDNNTHMAEKQMVVETQPLLSRRQEPRTQWLIDPSTIDPTSMKVPLLQHVTLSPLKEGSLPPQSNKIPETWP